MSNSNPYDIIIIGGGPAGLAAGLYAMRAAMKTVLIEKGVFGGQASITKEVENYLGFENISGMELGDRFLSHVQSYGLEVVREEVVAVAPGSELHSVKLSNGETLSAYAVILATGGTPRKLGVPGESKFYGRGVSYCAKCDGLFFRDQTVVVVGGGDSATEEAIYLSKIAREVHVVHLESQLRASRILQQRLMAACNLRIYPDTTVTEIRGGDQGVSTVLLGNAKTGNQREIEAEGVFIFVGLAPNNELGPAGLEMSPGGYAITNEKRETNIPGIFAAGDLRLKYASQVSIAVSDGCIAALAAAEYVDIKKEEKKTSCPYRPELRVAA